MDAQIQQLIAENEKLISQAQALTFDNVCKQQGVDPERVKKALSQVADEKSRKQAAEEIANDRAEVEQQIDMEVTRRGLRRATSGGIRRRMGQMI